MRDKRKPHTALLLSVPVFSECFSRFTAAAEGELACLSPAASQAAPSWSTRVSPSASLTLGSYCGNLFLVCGCTWAALSWGGVLAIAQFLGLL